MAGKFLAACGVPCVYSKLHEDRQLAFFYMLFPLVVAESSNVPLTGARVRVERVVQIVASTI